MTSNFKEIELSGPICTAAAQSMECHADKQNQNKIKKEVSFERLFSKTLLCPTVLYIIQFTYPLIYIYAYIMFVNVTLVRFPTSFILINGF